MLCRICLTLCDRKCMDVKQIEESQGESYSADIESVVRLQISENLQVRNDELTGRIIVSAQRDNEHSSDCIVNDGQLPGPSHSETYKCVVPRARPNKRSKPRHGTPDQVECLKKVDHAYAPMLKVADAVEEPRLSSRKRKTIFRTVPSKAVRRQDLSLDEGSYRCKDECIVEEEYANIVVYMPPSANMLPDLLQQVPVDITNLPHNHQIQVKPPLNETISIKRIVFRITALKNSNVSALANQAALTGPPIVSAVRQVDEPDGQGEMDQPIRVKRKCKGCCYFGNNMRRHLKKHSKCPAAIETRKNFAAQPNIN